MRVSKLKSRLDVSLRNADLLAPLISVYIGGIVFLGSQTLLGVGQCTASYLLVVTCLFHLIMTWSFGRIVGTRFVSNYLERVVGRSSSVFVKAELTATLVCLATISLVAIALYLLMGGYGPARFWFYWTVLALVVFLTSFLRCYRRFSSRLSMDAEKLKMRLSIWLEIFRGLVWALTLVVLGTAYSQILTGLAMSTLEMILISYTIVGALVFIYVPLIFEVFQHLFE